MFSAVHALFNHRGLRASLVTLRVPIALIMAVAVMYYADRRWLWPAFAVSMAGEFLQLWCFATLNKNASISCRGPYAVVRNPMYLGRFLILLGILMLVGQPWLLALFAVCYGFYMVNRVAREEKRLLPALGDAYAQYCAGTRRFLPGRPYRGEPVLVWDWSLFRQNHGGWNLIATLAFWAIAAGWVLMRAV